MHCQAEAVFGVVMADSSKTGRRTPDPNVSGRRQSLKRGTRAATVVTMVKPLAFSALAILFMASSSFMASHPQSDPTADKRRTPQPGSPAADPACEVTDIQKDPTIIENAAKAPRSDLTAISQMDANSIHQLYIKKGNGELNCLTCTARPGAPRTDREKMMVSFHPSGEWIFVGVEEDKHDNQWMPKSWQRGLLQSGIWLNIWITTPTGDRWYQITDYKKRPSDGFVGIAMTPDGKKAVWAEIVDGNVFVNAFGIWKLYAADFQVKNGTPALVNRKEITPKGAKWVEPGNFSPDGKHVLLSSDIGLKDPHGQDQWSVDIENGALKNLTNSPAVWDEHGLYSPNGKKITFMSSSPYQNERNANKTESLKTEFMLMDSDGGHLQQLTHFNMPGYPESQRSKTIAAVAQFLDDGAHMMATVMADNFTKTNWTITFRGRCGA